MAAMDAALNAVLAVAVPELRRYCIDPWVLIGSTAARLAGAVVTAPTVSAQIRMLESFGRPKDLRRAASLAALN